MRHNKRNKHIAIFIIILMFTIFFGCNILERIVFGNTYKQYHGNYPELYSVAINSILGTRGFAVSERPFESRVRPIETDSLGRVLFIYFENQAISSVSLVISQKKDMEHVYYYPDFNFISTAIPLPPDGYNAWDPTSNAIIDTALKKISGEEVEILKRRNDWNMNIDINKCEKVKIVRQKANGTVTNQKLKMFYEKVLLGDRAISPYIDFFNKDDYGRSMYLGYGKRGSNRVVVLLFRSDGSYDEKSGVMELVDRYNYQDDLKAFKERNNWNVKP